MSTTIRPPDPDRQRRNALRKANAVRRRRRETRNAIKQLAPPGGAQAACEIILGVPDWAASMNVARLLGAVNGFGSVRARRIAGVDANTPLARLDTTVRAAIASRTVREAAHLRKRGGAQPGPLTADHYAQAQQALQSAQRIRLARTYALTHIVDAADLAQRAARAADLIADSERDADLNGLTLTKILEAVFGRRDRRTAKLIAELDLRPTTELGMLSTLRAHQTAAALRACHGTSRGGRAGSRGAPAHVAPLARAA